MSNYSLFGIHRFNLGLVVFIKDAATDLQGVRQLTFLHGQVVWQEREALDLLIVSQLLLKGIDAFLHHLDDTRISTELFAVLKIDTMLAGILLKQ